MGDQLSTTEIDAKIGDIESQRAALAAEKLTLIDQIASQWEGNTSKLEARHSTIDARLKAADLVIARLRQDRIEPARAEALQAVIGAFAANRDINQKIKAIEDEQAAHYASIEALNAQLRELSPIKAAALNLASDYFTNAPHLGLDGDLINRLWRESQEV